MPRFSVLCDSSRAAGGQYGWVSSTGFADADRLRNKRHHSHALPTRSSAPRSSRPSRTARSFQSMRGIRYRLNSTRSQSFPGLPRQLRAATCLSWQLLPSWSRNSWSRNVNDPNRIRCRQVASHKRLAAEIGQSDSTNSRPATYRAILRKVLLDHEALTGVLVARIHVRDGEPWAGSVRFDDEAKRAAASLQSPPAPTDGDQMQLLPEDDRGALVAR